MVAIKDGVSVSLTGGSGRTPRHPHPSPPSFTAAGSSVGRCKGRGWAVRSDMVNNLSNFRSICCSLVSLPKSFVNRELIGSWSRAGAVERSDCFLWTLGPRHILTMNYSGGGQLQSCGRINRTTVALIYVGDWPPLRNKQNAEMCVLWRYYMSAESGALCPRALWLVSCVVVFLIRGDENRLGGVTTICGLCLDYPVVTTCLQHGRFGRAIVDIVKDWWCAGWSWGDDSRGGGRAGGRGWRIGALINIEAGTRCISSSFDLCGLPFVTELSHWRRGGCVQVLPSLPVWLTGPLCTGGVGWSGRIEACNGMWFGFLQKWSPIVVFILIIYER